MINVICLKHGPKYDSNYVNKLFNMVTRNLKLPYRFVCFTDDAANLYPEIEVRSLPSDEALSGWWWKLYVFKEGHFQTGDTNFFIDLDMVIVRNIDKLFDYMPDQFVGLQNLNRIFNRYPPTLGSAVMKWPANTYTDIWEKYKEDPSITRMLRGDQDWIWKLHNQSIKFFPSDWIISYKWEARNRTELSNTHGKINFKTVRNPTIPSNTSILAFHGAPDPHEVNDPIIVDNWR